MRGIDSQEGGVVVVQLLEFFLERFSPVALAGYPILLVAAEVRLKPPGRSRLLDAEFLFQPDKAYGIVVANAALIVLVVSEECGQDVL